METKKSFMNIVEDAPPPPPEEPKPVMSLGTDLSVDERLRDIVGEEFSLSAPKYTKVSKGPLHVSYAVVDGSHYYQIEMDQAPGLAEDILVSAIGQAFLAVVPGHIQVYIKLPPKDLNIFLYTAIAKDSAKLIGAKDYMESKLIDKLLQIDFWPGQRNAKNTRPRRV